jgi:hypothetical protein
MTMAHHKLTEEDDAFLNVPNGAVLVASGSDGAQTWLERDKDSTVRIVVASVAIATGDGAVLEAVLEVDGAQARGRAGPAQADTRLQTLQSVQVVLKPGQRLEFKAYPAPSAARVLKTVVYTADV